MKKRIKEICSLVPDCEIFADVGCDHGYVAEEIVKSGKCRKAIVSDVSEKCLLKAQTLLADYIAQGRVTGVVSDGFDNIPFCSCAVIAGMGGEEICSVIRKAKNLPQTLILQPMKNVDKLRLVCVKHGFRIEKDYVFEADGKYYDLIKAVKGEDELTPDETLFGRTNVTEKPPAFIKRLKARIRFIDGISGSLTGEDKEKLFDEKRRAEKYIEN